MPHMLAWYNHTTLMVGRLKQQLFGDGNDDMSTMKCVCWNTIPDLQLRLNGSDTLPWQIRW